MNATYDAIVIGLGAMGSATAAHLARRGATVLGLDAHPRGHALGSSHGKSRIIREAYHETPQYVPLVQRAYALWRELEAAQGSQLLTITGGLNLGRPDGQLVDGAIRSATLHGLPYQCLSAAEVAACFPGFRLPDGMMGVLSPMPASCTPSAAWTRTWTWPRGTGPRSSTATRCFAMPSRAVACAWRRPGARSRRISR